MTRPLPRPGWLRLRAVTLRDAQLEGETKARTLRVFTLHGPSPTGCPAFLSIYFLVLLILSAVYLSPSTGSLSFGGRRVP
jgi:hypothetical protein